MPLGLLAVALAADTKAPPELTVNDGGIQIGAAVAVTFAAVPGPAFDAPRFYLM